jgi:hypothetical protein
MPELVRFHTVKSTRTVRSSAFGGLIYITLPEGMNLPDQTITVTGGSCRCSLTWPWHDLLSSWVRTHVAAPPAHANADNALLILATCTNLGVV